MTINKNKVRYVVVIAARHRLLWAQGPPPTPIMPSRRNSIPKRRSCSLRARQAIEWYNPHARIHIKVR